MWIIMATGDAMVLWVLVALGLLVFAGVMIARLLGRVDASKSVAGATGDAMNPAQRKRWQSESRVMLAIVFSFPAAIAAMVGVLVLSFMFNASSIEPSSRAPIITVYAASSTSDVMRELVAAYREEANVIVQCNFSSSSALAKQIMAGAKADVYLSANEKWMQELADSGDIDPVTRFDLLGNRLVLIAASDSTAQVDLNEPGSVAAAMRGRLAVGDPDHVPAGIYAKEALTNLQQWEAVHRRLAPGADVRVALRYVATGSADLGVVYATDARVEPLVRVVATLPEASHQPVRYPVAVCSNASSQAAGFVAFLRSDRARKAFEHAGFVFLPETQVPSSGNTEPAR